MKQFIFGYFILLFSLHGSAQTSAQDFCTEIPSGSYFPLDIIKKKIIWANESYLEINKGRVSINETEYFEIVQKWSEGSEDTLYLREENQIVYQLNIKTGKETTRLNPMLKIGDHWTGESIYTKFKIISTNASLKTPFCSYTNLLALKAKYADCGGRYTFYYLKGYGYVGATTKKGVISYVTPFF